MAHFAPVTAYMCDSKLSLEEIQFRREMEKCPLSDEKIVNLLASVPLKRRRFQS